ncbi:TerC/Alx family metal homeostasis membrane protein [Deinococcus deserti]|uniref:Putative TerC family protein putative membrane protein n=1 Tax=Deinococcus deserti (strain DSM 17065 / CIP 109153 / LMG 22923 / VCD115) TaxID=546414 RepID=C1D223_DEIDV|nr:TerC/Alx family metal homeostasis membrane protein [Deinococcus deserti]ACO47462.1 putative TerC family protein; putative membrane protein [Deinococcus deserti VCD115]
MEFLLDLWLGKPAWMWLMFITLVMALLAFDLGVLGKRREAQAASGAGQPHEIGVKASLKLSLFYISVALLFGVWVWSTLGPQSGIEYLTGFAVEKALALDNVFVISVIFGALAIPRHLQHRVLVWGILGVIVLRGLMIGLGTALVTQFDWIMWVFGAFLLLTGIKLLLARGGHSDAPDLERHPVVRLLKRIIPVSSELDGQKFLTRLPEAGGRRRLHATPLLLALVLVEAADLVFAVDSIPAIFAITQDPFLVYTSNIFAILGLRALYFALDALIHRFEALKPALALVLMFIGGKIFYTQLFGKMDPALSLGITLSILAGGILTSLWKNRTPGPAAKPQL